MECILLKRVKNALCIEILTLLDLHEFPHTRSGRLIIYYTEFGIKIHYRPFLYLIQSDTKITTTGFSQKNSSKFDFCIFHLLRNRLSKLYFNNVPSIGINFRFLNNNSSIQLRSNKLLTSYHSIKI